MRRKKCNTLVTLVAAVVGVGLMAGQVSAVVVFSNGITGSSIAASTNDSNFPGYPVSSSDLLEGLMPDETLSYLGPNPGAEITNPSPVVLTDGEFGEYLDHPTPRPYIFVTSSNETDWTTLYYILGAAPGGHDITAIDTYTSMTRGSGRNRQDYIVSYATVANPGEDDFTPFAEVHAPYHPGSQHMHLSIDNLSGVTALKFEFPGQIAGYVGYREIDVHGAPVPEPTGLAGLGLAALGLMARRRRI